MANIRHIWSGRAASVIKEMLIPPERFAAEAEQAFLADYASRYALQRRIAIVIAVLTHVTFLRWDVEYPANDPAYPISAAWGLGLRLTNMVALTITFLLSLRPQFERDEVHATRLLFAATVVSAGINGASAYWCGYPYDMLFGMGLFLSLVFTYSVLRFRARTILWLMLMTFLYGVAIYSLAHLKTPPEAPFLEQVHGTVLVQLLQSLCLLGVFVGNMGERSERARFVRERQLASLNEDLAGRNAHIEHLNRKLRATAKEREERTAALIQVKDQMRLSAEARSREVSIFLASAVHDLKQPLQAVAFALEPALHAAEQNDQDKTLEMLHLTRAAASKMRTQLAAILELSQLQAARLHPDVAVIDLEALVRDQLRLLSDQGQHGDIEVSFTMQGDGPWLCSSDPHFVRRILNNLLSNALKYRRVDASDTSWVRITLSGDEQQQTLIVADNGQGIPAEALADDQIFKPFFQASNNQLPEAQRGVGLGLSIVRNMVDLLPGHEVEVRSELGVGSSFSLVLPSAPRGAQPSMPDAQPNLSPQLLARLRGQYVLLVEDDELVRVSTVRLLHTKGVRCDAFSSFESFEAGLQNLDRLPGVIISDYRLPQGHTAMDVIEAARPLIGQVKVVVITGELIDEEVSTQLQDQHVLSKPAESEDLLRAIAESLPPADDGPAPAGNVLGSLGSGPGQLTADGPPVQASLL